MQYQRIWKKGYLADLAAFHIFFVRSFLSSRAAAKSGWLAGRQKGETIWKDPFVKCDAGIGKGKIYRKIDSTAWKVVIWCELCFIQLSCVFTDGGGIALLRMQVDSKITRQDTAECNKDDFMEK